MSSKTWKIEEEEERGRGGKRGNFQISLLIKLSFQRSISLNFGQFNMALLYQCNGLERANPQWHTNQSLSITVMTDFPIINPPAVPHMKSSLIVSISEDKKSPETLKTIEPHTGWTEGKFNTKENYKLLHQHVGLLGTGGINLQPQQKGGGLTCAAAMNTESRLCQ